MGPWNGVETYQSTVSLSPKEPIPQEYQEMVQLFAKKTWNFLEVSRQYILGDVIALHQTLTSFFTGLNSKFPIDPLKSLSIPGIAFTTWKTVQLPRPGAPTGGRRSPRGTSF